MSGRKIIFPILLICISTWILGSDAFAAGSTAVQKAKVMAAAGNVKTDSQPPDEKNAKIKREKAAEFARKYLDDSNEYGLETVNFITGLSSSDMAWAVDFVSGVNPLSHYTVTFDAITGSLLYYSVYEERDGTGNDESGSHIAKLTRGESRAYAEAFLEERLKLDLANYELQNEPWTAQYKTSGIKEPLVLIFHYKKFLKGVAFNSDTIEIGVNAENGRVVQYNRNFAALDSSKLKTLDKAISADKALEKLRQHSKLSLRYVTLYNNLPYGNEKPRVRLVYMPPVLADKLDAVTGSPLNADGSEMTDSHGMTSEGALTALNPHASISQAEKISSAKADTIAKMRRKAAERILGITFEGRNSQVYAGDSNLNYDWYASVKNKNYGINIALNTKSGRTCSFVISGNDTTDKAGRTKSSKIKAKLDWEQGRQKAVQIFKALLPEQYGFYAETCSKAPAVSQNKKDTQFEYTYGFIRLVNGIPFSDNSARISFDRQTGKLIQFYFKWSDPEFPKAGGLITAEKAGGLLFGRLKLQPAYFQKSSYNEKLRKTVYDTIPKLVYNLDVGNGYSCASYIYVDAVSGEILDFNGNALPFVKSDAGKPADRNIELLSCMGILTAGKAEATNSGKALNRLDAVRMLSLARGMQHSGNWSPAQTFQDLSPSDPDFFIVENAVGLGIIPPAKNLNGNEKLTRDEYAGMLANMLGYSEMIKHPELFRQMEGAGRNTENGAAAIICKTLGIFPADQPGKGDTENEKITLGEAASILYKALAYLRG